MTIDKEQALEHLRMVEALLFAAGEALSVAEIAERLPDDADVEDHIDTIHKFYAGRGVNLVQLAGKWMFRTAPDLSFLLRKEVQEQTKLSRAGVETLAIIAYHQPVTRAEIEEVRGVGLSKGTLDVLMEAGWVRLKGRRRTPGRPVTYGTTESFLVHFGLADLDDLPGVEELKAAGLLDSVESALVKMEEEMARQKAEQPELELEDSDEDGCEPLSEEVVGLEEVAAPQSLPENDGSSDDVEDFEAGVKAMIDGSDLKVVSKDHE
jgi:segregation and condensation protein B